MKTSSLKPIKTLSLKSGFLRQLCCFRRFGCFAALCCSAVLFLSDKAALNACAKEAFSMNIPIFSETQNLDFPRNSASFWFSIPKGTLLSEHCSLYLHISASDTLISERSAITFSINETTLTTHPISDIVESENGFIHVKIPKELLRTDSMNELKITTTQRSIEGDCADIDNPSNWVNLHDDSYLHLSISDYGTPDLGTLYPYFYNALTTQDRIENEFILGNISSTSQLNAMLKLAGAAGENAPYMTNLKTNVSQGDASGRLTNRIYIGLANDLKAAPFKIPSSLSESQGYLAISGNGKENSLIISALSDEGLLKAVRFAEDNDYLKQLTSSSQVVTTALPERKSLPALKQDGYYTLADFNYEDTNLAGAFHQQVSYTIQQPNGLKAGERSYVEIHFRHSEALVADNSLMTVFIDGIPQGSAKLSSGNADDGMIKVSIPSEVLSKESFTVSVECYNYLGKVDCSKDYYDTAWTLIEKSSVIYLEPGEDGFRPTLSGFPIFPATETDGNVTMVLPSESNEDDLALAAMISTRAGQNSPKGLIWDTAMSSNDLTGDQKNHNLIFFGHLSENSLPSEIAGQLTVLPTKEDTYRLKDGIAVTGETLSEKLILQSIRSPYNYNRRIYVALYANDLSDDRGDVLLARMLSDKTFLNRLEGHVALTADGETFTTFTLESDGAFTEEIPLTVERILYLIEKYTGISIWGLALILILIILVIVLVIKIMKNKNRFTNAASKMQQENESPSQDINIPEKTDN